MALVSLYDECLLGCCCSREEESDADEDVAVITFGSPRTLLLVAADLPPVDLRFKSADLRFMIFLTAFTPLPIEEVRLGRALALEEFSVLSIRLACSVFRRRESYRCDWLGGHDSSGWACGIKSCGGC